MSYSVPQGSCERELEIKKSRFIGFATKVSNRDDALAQVAAVKVRYPDARHHCWAYVLGNSESAAMNDDGEPSGTAGKPILNVLQHKGIGDVLVVVTRYFGGIKLGAGGLVRAYSQATELVMSALSVEKLVAKVQLTLQCDFAAEQPIRHFIGLHQGEVNGVDYSSQVTLSIEIPEQHVVDIAQICERFNARLQQTD
ncbi:MAG: YigZ family protein [Aliidiomarina sp.]|uniref:YigZ family protein n=1 Tax=Aliidiomarina sp. TaxID=1872439 RepID=UPI0025C17ACF|nr:YigZ family protein [Aliidiomarina sp.]MCH8501437.1 YigZ family protein [Aliidiomarina sp.]